MLPPHSAPAAVSGSVLVTSATSREPAHDTTFFTTLNAWLVSMMLCRKLTLVLMFALTFVDALQENLSKLPRLKRLRFERACWLFQCLHSPPPQIVTDSTRCEFAAGKCKKSVGETECCASRRCEVHSAKKLVCCCWIALTSTKSRPTERRKPNCPELNCEMPTKPPKKSCSDCMTGLITCTRHMGTCVNLAWIVCELCTRLKCGKCLGKTCCAGYGDRANLVKLDEVKGRDSTADIVSRTSPTPAPVSAATSAPQRHPRNIQVTTTQTTEITCAQLFVIGTLERMLAVVLGILPAASK